MSSVCLFASSIAAVREKRRCWFQVAAVKVVSFGWWEVVGVV